MKCVFVTVKSKTTYAPSGDENVIAVASATATIETTYTPSGDENTYGCSSYSSYIRNNLRPVRGRKPCPRNHVGNLDLGNNLRPVRGRKPDNTACLLRFLRRNNLHPVGGRKPPQRSFTSVTVMKQLTPRQGTKTRVHYNLLIY